MSHVTYETQDLRVRIEDNIARVDQRHLEGEPWREIDHNELPMSGEWMASPMRTSPLRIALRAFELEHPGDVTLRNALVA